MSRTINVKAQNPEFVKRGHSKVNYILLFSLMLITFFGISCKKNSVENGQRVSLSVNQSMAGTVTGAGTFSEGSVVNVVAVNKAGFAFTNWTEGGTIVSTSPSYQFTLSGSRTLIANFISVSSGNFALNISSNPAIGGATAGSGSYVSGSVEVITAIPNQGYTFTSWSGDATGSVNPLTITMGANKNIVANFTLNPNPVAIGPGVINLGTAGDFSILTKTGISTTGVTSISGDIGVSPASAASITGFGLTLDAGGLSSQAPIVIGKAYAADYSGTTPIKMTTAISNMETAYTTANALINPAPIVNLYAGDISGRILPPGLYKWNTGVLITNAGVTLSGGPNDTWVFQIAQNFTVDNSANITLIGGAQAKNIFWVVAGQATLGSSTNVNGIILSKTLISMNTGAKITGKLLAQTAVTLNASTVIKP